MASAEDWAGRVVQIQVQLSQLLFSVSLCLCGEKG